MHYLGLALYAEGPTDYRFLSPVLRRLCDDLCRRGATRPVEVSDVLGLDHPKALAKASRRRRVVAAAEEAGGAWRVLFVHADGAGNPVKARAQQIRPALVDLSVSFPSSCEGVAVVPVKETEAWMLVDGNALRATFGTSLTDESMGLPAGGDATERDEDPKKTLGGAFQATNPNGLRARRGVSPFLGSLGERVELDRLRRLDSFRSLESDLVSVLIRFAILSEHGAATRKPTPM